MDVFTACLLCNRPCRVLHIRAELLCSLLAQIDPNRLCRGLQVHYKQKKRVGYPALLPPIASTVAFPAKWRMVRLHLVFTHGGLSPQVADQFPFPRFDPEVVVSLFIALMLLSVFTACHS